MRICDGLAIVGSLQFGLSGSSDCHVYAIRGDQGVVLIDAGAGTHTEKLLRTAAADLGDAPVVALLITHAHIDHLGGAAAIRKNTGCKVIAPSLCRDTMEIGDEKTSGLRAAHEQGVYPADLHLQSCKVDATVEDGESFLAGGLQFTAIQVRGHSPDAHCYLTRVSGQSWLFTGDIVFYGGVLGVINAEGSGMEGYRSDIGKLRGRGVDGLFPGHGMFTLTGGQRHLDLAIEQVRKGFLGRQIGQGDSIF